MGKKLNIKANFKKSTKGPEVKSDAWALLAAPLWILPSSLLKLSGWAGLLASFAATWLTGAFFDIQGLRRGAWALGGTHLLYTKGSGFITGTLKIPLWDMYGAKTTVQGLGNYELQTSDTRILPVANRQITARPMNQVSGYEKMPALAGLGDEAFEQEREIGI
jgi:hypothetical protein